MQPESEASQYRPNPYSPSNLGIEFDEHDQVIKFQVDFAPILHRWEKYRLVYNGVLICHTLFFTVLLVPQMLPRPLYWMQLALGGLVTNLCFFTGPAIEGYGRYFRVWNVGMSLALFSFGLLFSGFLALAFVFVSRF